MPQSKDGQKFHSFGRAALHDSMSHRSSTAVGQPSLGGKPNVSAEHTQGADSKEDIHQVVEEHGPAHTIHHHHDHEANMHHVVSYHGEHTPEKPEGHGFTHHSTHPSHVEAHQHMGHALGIGHEESESPEYESAEREGAEEASNIPGMK
jgi:hypothetical protein